MKTIFLTVLGFASGSLVAGGIVALMVGLGIITRFAGITHQARHVRWFETFICLGGICGSLLTIYYPGIPAGWPALFLLGTFSGIFVGGWIMALAELLDVFPVVIRRLNLTRGNSWIVLSLAAGKVLGSLLEFYKRWGKV